MVGEKMRYFLLHFLLLSSLCPAGIIQRAEPRGGLIYFDHYAAPQYYGALRSSDLVHWEDVSQKVKFPQGTRHGTVLRVSEEVVARLR
jgi:hypothetical protein